MDEDSQRRWVRAARREARRRKQRARMAKHGAGVRRVYRDAILKRLAFLRKGKGRKRQG